MAGHHMLAVRASGRGCQAACPGGYLIRPLLTFSSAATKAFRAVIMVHHDRCPKGTTSDPERPQPLEGPATSLAQDSLGRRPDGQGTPHSTGLLMGSGSCLNTHGQTPCTNSTSAAPQLNPISQGGNFPRGQPPSPPLVRILQPGDELPSRLLQNELPF